jgi:hypothetical protein
MAVLNFKGEPVSAEKQATLKAVFAAHQKTVNDAMAAQAAAAAKK